MGGLKAIAAVNNGGWIGLNGKLPWKSSADFKHFKSLTMGGICIIGKRTWEIDLNCKPLPGRRFLVVGTGYYTLWKAIETAVCMQMDDNAKIINAMYQDPNYMPDWTEIWVIGGASIYKQLWPLITELHLSVINNDTVGDRRLDVPADFRGKTHVYKFEENKKETK